MHLHHRQGGLATQRDHVAVDAVEADGSAVLQLEPLPQQLPCIMVLLTPLLRLCVYVWIHISSLSPQ